MEPQLDRQYHVKHQATSDPISGLSISEIMSKTDGIERKLPMPRNGGERWTKAHMIP
jgi:zinc finger protein CreA/MIG